MTLLRTCEFRDLGRLPYGRALQIQQDLAAQRKEQLIPDQLLIVEHPHVITLGRNAHEENILASDAALAAAGIALYPTNRGGDVTYHGPGQIVGYPILDLRDWKRDVMAYVRALEQVLIDAIADFGIVGERDPSATGVWVKGGKVAAIGVHLSRWVTSHGFALNLDTDLSYFRYIVPCGLTKPVASLRQLGCAASRETVVETITAHFARVFDLKILEPALEGRAL